jgi:hypothetical protein
MSKKAAPEAPTRAPGGGAPGCNRRKPRQRRRGLQRGLPRAGSPARVLCVMGCEWGGRSPPERLGVPPSQASASLAVAESGGWGPQAVIDDLYFPVEIEHDTLVDLLRVGWIAVDALLIAVVVGVVLRFRSRLFGHGLDLGAVSDSWINAHRSEAHEHYRKPLVR